MDSARVERIAANLVVISNLIAANDNVSWIPRGRGGYEPNNLFLFLSPTHVLLVDSGLAAHGAAVIDALRDLVGDRAFAVYVTRSELDAIGNLARIIECFPRVDVVTANPVPPLRLIHMAASAPRPKPSRLLKVGEALGDYGFPRLDILRPVVRTLGTTWLFDRDGGALCTTDCFSGDLMRTPDEPVVRRNLDGRPSAAELRAALIAKFDWLAAANTEELRPVWDAFFAGIKPTTIAPMHGRPQAGADLVRAVLADMRTAIFDMQDAA